jgi:hypothetical protein
MSDWFYCPALAQEPQDGLTQTRRDAHRWLLWAWLSQRDPPQPQLLERFSDQNALEAYCQTYGVIPQPQDHPQLLLDDWSLRLTTGPASMSSAPVSSAKVIPLVPTPPPNSDTPPSPSMASPALNPITWLCAIRGLGIAAWHDDWVSNADGQPMLWHTWPDAYRTLQEQGHRPALWTPQSVVAALHRPADALPSAQRPWYWAQWTDDAWGLWQGSVDNPILWQDRRHRPVLLRSLSTAQQVARRMHPAVWTPVPLWLDFHAVRARHPGRTPGRPPISLAPSRGLGRFN